MRYPTLVVILLTAILAAPAIAAQGANPADEGSALLRVGRLAEAIPLLEQAVQTDPQDVIALNNLGVALIQVGRFDEAIRCFDLVIEAQPNNALAYAIQAVAHNQTGEPMLAAQTAQQALRLDPNIVEAHYSLGVAWGRLGNGPGAITEQDWLYRNDPRLASRLTAELVEIDPSYDRIDMAGDSGSDPAERPMSAATIGEMPEIVPADLEPEEPGDSITLLGVTAERAYPWDEDEWDGTMPDLVGLLESWFDDFAGLGEEQGQGSASGEAERGQNE